MKTVEEQIADARIISSSKVASSVEARMVQDAFLLQEDASGKQVAEFRKKDRPVDKNEKARARIVKSFYDSREKYLRALNDFNKYQTDDVDGYLLHIKTVLSVELYRSDVAVYFEQKPLLDSNEQPLCYQFHVFYGDTSPYDDDHGHFVLYICPDGKIFKGSVVNGIKYARLKGGKVVIDDTTTS